MTQPTPFKLVKWYMDCVTDEGEVAILYCASLNWRGLSAGISNLLTAHGQVVEAHTSVSGYSLTQTSNSIQVTCHKLRASGQWKAISEPFEQTIYQDSSGSVLWSCLQPAAQAAVHTATGDFTGLGYAECLILTIAPWHLPLRQLRWGRFVSDHHSLVWIDWQGDHTTRIARLNSAPAQLLTATESEVSVEGANLYIGAGMPLRTGPLNQTILPGAPALAKLFPNSVFNIRERKWRSRGTLTTPNGASEGWVIHEVVDWEL
jgi:hypothetical protein